MKNLLKPANVTGFPALKVFILVTGLALAACSWYVLANWLRGEGDIVWFSPSGECNLHLAPCSATLGDRGLLTLTIDVDGPIEALDVLPLDVEVEGVTPSQVSVDFVGRDMEMGLNRFALTATAPGHFHGQGQVGVCTQAVMPWRARVILETPDGKLGSWFDFDVTRS